MIDEATLRRALALPIEERRARLFEDARAAAVLVPVLFGGGREARVVMLLRSSALRDHAGEVGFPGGKAEEHDADLAATALREAEEEVALAPGDVEIVGTLASCPVITGKFMIHPFVGLVRSAVPRAVSTEVARLFEVPLLPWITGAQVIHATGATWNGRMHYTPHFCIDDVVLYGASAVIFHELVTRVATAMGREVPEAVVVEGRPWGDRYGLGPMLWSVAAWLQPVWGAAGGRSVRMNML